MPSISHSVSIPLLALRLVVSCAAPMLLFELIPFMEGNHHPDFFSFIIRYILDFYDQKKLIPF